MEEEVDDDDDDGPSSSSSLPSSSSCTSSDLQVVLEADREWLWRKTPKEVVSTFSSLFLFKKSLDGLGFYVLERHLLAIM